MLREHLSCVRGNCADYQLESPTPESPTLISLIIPYQNWGLRRWGFRRYMTPNHLSPQSMACKGSNATGVLLICIMSMLHVITFISIKCLDALNNPNINYAFLGGTFKIAPKFISQVWILRGFIIFATPVCLLPMPTSS